MLRLFLILLLILPATVSAQAVDVAKRRITLALATEPPTLDSMQSTDQISSFILAHVKEGLLQYGPDGELIPGVAERWELDERGARFWLRRDARWSDGRPVTARDFVFAWRRAVDPATASQYAFIFYPLRNAIAINNGELPVEALGVEAVSERELVVHFAKPCPYFLSLTAFMSYYPAREDVVAQHDRAYAADRDKLLYNGPFTLSRWIHSAHITLEKNPHYWDRDAVALKEIDMPFFTGDTSAQYNLFRDGRIALAAMDTGILGDALERGYAIEQFQNGTLFFLEFNFRSGRLTANRALRKAIQSVLSPDLLVNKVVGMVGVLPARSLFPHAVKGVEGSFRDEYPAPPVSLSVSEGRRWLAQAQRELDLQRLPPLVLLSGDSPRASREAEYYQYVLQRALGLEVRLDQQNFKQRLARMTSGEFDIVATGWGPDFDDALTFGDLLASWNENNRGRYADPAYDRWVRIAQESVDLQPRFAAFAQLQRIIIDDAVIVPLYENATVYVQHPRLKGVVRSIFGGDPNFRFAWLE